MKNGKNLSRVDALTQKLTDAGIEGKIWSGRNRLRIYLTLPTSWLVPEGFGGPLSGIEAYIEYDTPERIRKAREPWDGHGELGRGSRLQIKVRTGRAVVDDFQMSDDLRKRMQNLMEENGLLKPRGTNQTTIPQEAEIRTGKVNAPGKSMII